MLMVEVEEGPQHQACLEEGEAEAHPSDCPHLLWTATAGWQAGPETCCHFCLLEEAVGEGLEQQKRQQLRAIPYHGHHQHAIIECLMDTCPSTREGGEIVEAY